MSEVTVSTEAALPPGASISLSDAVVLVLERELGPAAERCSVGVSIVEPGRIRELNLQWRDEDSATDVLSFPADAPPRSPEGPPVPLGDVVIAPECVSPAVDGTHLGGLILCAVHGTLHLLGHDHDDPEREAEMFGLQDRYSREVLER